MWRGSRAEGGGRAQVPEQQHGQQGSWRIGGSCQPTGGLPSTAPAVPQPCQAVWGSSPLSLERQGKKDLPERAESTTLSASQSTAPVTCQDCFPQKTTAIEVEWEGMDWDAVGEKTNPSGQCTEHRGLSYLAGPKSHKVYLDLPHTPKHKRRDLQRDPQPHTAPLRCNQHYL